MIRLLRTLANPGFCESPRKGDRGLVKISTILPLQCIHREHPSTFLFGYFISLQPLTDDLISGGSSKVGSPAVQAGDTRETKFQCVSFEFNGIGVVYR